MANGVIKEVGKKEKSFYTAKDVMELISCGRVKAYDIIKQLRGELISSGKLSDCYPTGKIPKAYFNERMMIIEE